MVIIRFFDVYDGATKGEPVAEVLKNAEKQQKVVDRSTWSSWFKGGAYRQDEKESKQS